MVKVLKYSDTYYGYRRVIYFNPLNPHDALKHHFAYLKMT